VLLKQYAYPHTGSLKQHITSSCTCDEKRKNEVLAHVSSESSHHVTSDPSTAEALRDAAKANSREGEARDLRRPMIIQLPGATRIWSTATTFRITAEQDLFIDAYFAAEDPLNPSRGIDS